MDNKIKMKEVVKSRENTYGFIAGIFREELNSEQIKEMMDKGILNQLIEGGCNIKMDFFSNKSVEHIEEELAVEYAELFIGPGKHIAPYESIYVADSDGRVGYYWGESTVDIKNWVEHYELKISDQFESIPDHISIELEFMQKVIGQERLEWERDDIQKADMCIEIERTFFNNHINKWVVGFCEQVIEAAHLDFYREIASLTKDFMIQEKELLL